MRNLQVKVKPNSRDTSLEEAPDGTWIARVKAPPVDGKANDELIGMIAKHFGVTRSQVTIRSGRLPAPITYRLAYDRAS